MTVQPTIVFDLDGTLADTIHDLVSALNRTLGRFQLPRFTPSEVAHLTGKGGLRAMIGHAFELGGMPFEQSHLEDAFVATVKDYDRNIAVESVLYHGARASLETFKSEGWLLTVCTNKPMAQAKKLLRELNVIGFFAAITGVDSFEFKKPDPRHLIRTIEIAGGLKTRAVMVGDTHTDVLTARNAGIPVIAVDFGYSEVHVKSLAPDCVISDFETLYAEAAKLVS